MNKYVQILLHNIAILSYMTLGTPLVAMQQPEKMYSKSDLFLAVHNGDLKTIVRATKAPPEIKPDFNAVSPQTKLTALGTACHIVCDLLNDQPPFDEIKNDPLPSNAIAMKNLRYPNGIKPFIGMILYLSFFTNRPSTEEDNEARMQVLYSLAQKDCSLATFQTLVTALFVSYGKQNQLSMELEAML